MMSYSQDKTKFAQWLPESIWLEPEDFEEAAQVSNPVTGEAQQWQSYVNGLALIGFERWVNQRDANLSVNRENCSLFQRDNGIDVICNLKVGEFQVCLIVTEELTDNVSVPNGAVDSEFAGHFYVVMEVLEEQEQVSLSGFLRYDKLIDYRDSVKLQVSEDRYYQIPLSLFDSEMNHLLFYSRYLEPSAIPLSVPETMATNAKIGAMSFGAPGESLVNLSQWLNNIFDAGWQTIEEVLAPPQAQLAFNLRSAIRTQKSIVDKPIQEVERVKLLSSELKQEGNSVALLVGLIPEKLPNIDISVEVYPTAGKTELPEDMELMILDDSGKAVMQAQAKNSQTMRFNFSGEPGDFFRVKVVLSDISFTEAFVI